MTEIELVKLVVWVYFIAIFGGAGIGMVLNVLQSVGVYRMSEKMGINRPWYAFVPFLSIYAIGRLGDECVKHAGKKRLGKLTLGVYIVYMVVIIALVFVMINSVFDLVLLEETAYLPENGDQYNSFVFGIVASLIGVYLLLFAFAIICSILNYISLWRIYSAFDGTNAVVYEVLSIFFPFLTSIFLFLVRKKEFIPEPVYNYMPQQVVIPAPQPVEPTAEQPAEETTEE